MAKPAEDKEDKNPNKKPLEINPNSMMVVSNAVMIVIMIVSMLIMYIALDSSFNKKIAKLMPEQEQIDSEEGDEELQEGLLLDLGDFILNLADGAHRRYLKVGIAIELSKTQEEIEASQNSENTKNAHSESIGDVANSPIAQEMERFKPAIRDAVISVLSNKTSDELSTPTGKEIAKEEITQMVNNIFEGQREVMRISFGQFIIQ